MADISLHYSSKAPLAGTFTAFSQILATWRRRAQRAARARQPRLPHAARPRPERQRHPVRGQQALLARAKSPNPEPGPFVTLPGLIPLRTLAGGRSSASLSTAGFFFARECPHRAPDRTSPAALLLWRHDLANYPAIPERMVAVARAAAARSRLLDDCTLRDLGLSARPDALRGTKTVLARLTLLLEAARGSSPTSRSRPWPATPCSAPPPATSPAPSRCWRRSSTARPNSGQALHLLGQARLKLGRFAEAREPLERAAKFLPKEVAAQVNSPAASSVLGEHEAALCGPRPRRDA